MIALAHNVERVSSTTELSLAMINQNRSTMPYVNSVLKRMRLNTPWSVIALYNSSIYTIHMSL